jgi:hypothetical protein
MRGRGEVLRSEVDIMWRILLYEPHKTALFGAYSFMCHRISTLDLSRMGRTQYSMEHMSTCATESAQFCGAYACAYAPQNTDLKSLEVGPSKLCDALVYMRHKIRHFCGACIAYAP